jgi:hypothetical protein
MEKDVKELLSPLGKVEVFGYWGGVTGGFMIWWMDDKNEYVVDMAHSFDGLQWDTLKTEEVSMAEFVETAEAALAENRPLIKCDNAKMLEVGYLVLGAKGGTTVRVAMRLHKTGLADPEVRKRFDGVRERMFEFQGESVRIGARVNPLKKGTTWTRGRDGEIVPE